MIRPQNRRYWDNTITGNPIVPSRTSILETLPKIVASPPKIQPKNTSSAIGHFFFVLRQRFSNHPLVSVGIAIGVIIGLAIFGRSWIRKSKNAVFGTTGGFFQLKGDLMEKGAASGGGLLGGNGNTGGKVD